jgi:lambda repressor-like predicted transcriptional regulator
MGIREVMAEFREKHPAPMGVATLLAPVKVFVPKKKARERRYKAFTSHWKTATINKELRYHMESKKISPKDLAEKLDVSGRSVSYWLYSGATPSPRYRKHIANFFGVSEQALWPTQLQNCNSGGK